MNRNQFLNFGWLSSLTKWSCGIGMVFTWICSTLAAPRISEFLASNQGGLRDEDGDSPDWIEIHNPDGAPLNLANWALTDTTTNLTQWRFPATNLPQGGFLVVFASGKDRRPPGGPLHTNFRLGSDGEYLALVAPDGMKVVSEFGVPARPQFPNVSYGLGSASTVILLAPDASARAFVPADDQLDTRWRERVFDDSAWTAGKGGVGYETSPADYAGLLGLSLDDRMINQNGSCYARFSFNVSDLSGLSGLRLVVQYDDGFVAWLNGREVARRNAPGALAWNSLATADHPDDLAVVPEEIDLSAFTSSLVAGPNVLAVQCLNVRLDSSDALVRVQLDAERGGNSSAETYFTVPTPGAANRGGTAALGPLVRDVQHSPEQPTPADDIVVTARVEKTFAPIATVTLHRRVMFNAETSASMFDDGQHGDGAANDGVFGAMIPKGTAGQMVRYRITARDTSARETRLPLFFDPRDSEEYFGLVVAAAGITSALPVVHLFVQNTGASESFAGTRASLSFLGEFYDNISISLRGQSTSGFPKKGFNLDFNRDHRFRYATNSPRVKDIKLLTNYADKSRVRNALACGVINQVGSAGHFSFPVRVQRNAAFHGIFDVMEDGDDRWLERLGRNPEGALYKIYNSLEGTGGAEKKNRKEEGTADLQALITNLAESRPLATRATYAYDNLDLPQIVSYFAAHALISNADHGHKNYYLYRDSTGSGEWALFPWDVDLSFGHNWLNDGAYFVDTIFTNNAISFQGGNRLYNLIFSHADFRRMYLRRLRTVMDAVLQPPETSPANGVIENRIRELLDLLDPPNIAASDADLDESKWGSWGTRRTTRAEAQRLMDVYLPGRRRFLNGTSVSLGGERIPSAQPAGALVNIDQVDFNPASGRQSEEFIRLTNPQNLAVDISGWQLRGEVEHTFRPGTVILAGRSLYAARDAAGFRNRAASPKRGENLFVQGNYRGQLSARGGALELLDTAGRVAGSFSYQGQPTPLQRSLRLSELMFQPAPPPAGSPFSAGDFEFIELANVGAEPLDLTGARFTEGIEFTFTGSAAAQLPPGGRVLVVKNIAAFTSRYGAGWPLAGEFSGNLANEGESVRMEDNVGEVVFEFRYRADWPAAANSAGHSLEPLSPAHDLDTAGAWQPSASAGGSPGLSPWTLAIASYSVQAGQFVVQFRAEASRSYALEQSATLLPGDWHSVSEHPATAAGGMVTLTTPLPPNQPAQFFRLSLR